MLFFLHEIQWRTQEMVAPMGSGRHTHRFVDAVNVGLAGDDRPNDNVPSVERQ